MASWMCFGGVGVCSLFFGSLFLAIAILMRVEQEKYTPIYEDVHCDVSSVEFKRARLSPLLVYLDVSVTCSNPNPYEILIRPKDKGLVLLGEQKRDVGVVVAKEKTMSSESWNAATLIFEITLQLSFLDTLALLGNVLSGAFPVIFELSMHVEVEPALTFLGVKPLQISMPVEQMCGMELQLLPGQETGSVVCGDTVEVSAIPLLNPPQPNETETSAGDNVTNTTGSDSTGHAQSAHSGESGFTPDVDEKVLQDAEESRDAICKPIIAVSLILSCFVFSLPLCFYMCYKFKRTRVRINSLETTPTKIGFAGR